MKEICRAAILNLVFSFLILTLFVCNSAAMTVNGPITANDVAVNGDVTVSSITVSSITITNLINVPVASSLSGNILQMKFSSSTVESNTVSSTWTAVDNIQQSLTLLNATDYVHIYLTGSLYSECVGMLTIFRDDTNLGDTTFGLTSSPIPGAAYNVEGTGIYLTDSPGDTTSHKYQVYICANCPPTALPVKFPYASTGYLLVEEVQL